VGVPSRLYTPPSAERPLNGLRVTVKDNYHLAGVHTTLGSRSYAKLYGPQSQTSELVKRLVDLGAVIIGKTKMGAYAGSEVPRPVRELQRRWRVGRELSLGRYRVGDR